jgi:hypothetical protein
MADASNWSPLIRSPAWRFSLKQLLIWMALIAVGCVALRSANTTWVSSLLGLTLLILGASLLFALYRDGQSRAYWIGFAMIGWLYLVVLLYGWSLDLNSPGSWGNPLRPDELVTSRVTHKCYAWLYPPQAVQAPMGGSMGPGMGGMGMGGMAMNSGEGMSGYAGSGMMGGPGGMSGMSGGMPPGGMMGTGTMMVAAPGPSQQDFTNVAHSLWALLLATCGGWLATWLFATRERSRPATA